MSSIDQGILGKRWLAEQLLDELLVHCSFRKSGKTPQLSYLYRRVDPRW
jgi:hypothetical protein